MPILQSSTLNNQNITSALLVGTYTATRELSSVMAVVMADQVAGNGNYTLYLTRQINGAGSAYKSAVTTVALASGVTALYASTIQIPILSGDVIKVYLTGLAGDTTTPDITCEFWDLGYLRPTVAGRTLDVTATGGAGIDWANVESPTTALDLSGTSTKALEPTVDGRTLDVTATGAAGIDWGNVENKTATNALTNTSISATGVTATVAVTTSQAAQVAAGNLSMTSHFSGEQVFDTDITDDLAHAVIWLAIKCNKFDTDDKSLFMVKVGDLSGNGLMYINGATPIAPVVAADASLTVTGSSGDWHIAAAWNARASAVLDGLEGDYYLAIKYSLGTDDLPVSEGTASLNQGGIQAV